MASSAEAAAELRVDPRRFTVPRTGILVRAQAAPGCWGSHDVAHLDKESLLVWIAQDPTRMPQLLLLMLGHR